MPAPNINSNYYIMQSYGGWSPCVQGNNAHGLRPFAGSVLPNCVGFATGRFNEMMGLGACTYLGSTDAMYFMQFASSQGLATGSVPRVGACMVWDDAAGEGGHVAIVESVVDGDTVTTYESGWNYTTTPIVRSRTRTRNSGAGGWGYGGTFLGFIYPPQPIGSDIIAAAMIIWRNEEDDYIRYPR